MAGTPPASADLNNYVRLLPAFQRADARFGSSGFQLTAWPIQREHTSYYPPPEEYELLGVCELPGIEGFPSEAYALHAACRPELADALEAFRELASEAGTSLPTVIRDVLPPLLSGGAIALWAEFVWYFGLPFRRDRAKLEWHFERVGSGILGRGLLAPSAGWELPFRMSSVAIERCRLHTDSPVLGRLEEIPGLVKRPVPAIAVAPSEDASTPDARAVPADPTSPPDEEHSVYATNDPKPVQTRSPAITVDAGNLMERVAIALGEENTVRILAISQDTKLSADQRMRQIYEIDARCLGWLSPKWAKLLAVTPEAVRQTPWWREDRKRLSRPE